MNKENTQKIMEKTIKQLTCLWCGYSWYPRKEGDYPKQCPNCKIYKWDKPRTTKQPKVDFDEPNQIDQKPKEEKVDFPLAEKPTNKIKPKKSLFKGLFEKQ